MVWRLSTRPGHKISGPSERVPLPIIEGLTKIRFAPTETLLDFGVYLSKEEINDARQSH
jgi:hypothetical protein